MALSVVDATDRVEQLVTLTETLTARLTAEAAAFEARRPLDAVADLDETAKLANLYRHECTRVKANPDMIAGAPREARDRLAAVTRAFELVMSRHARGLEAARILTEGLVRALAQEMASARAPAAGYGATGATTQGDTTAVTLNRQA